MKLYIIVADYGDFHDSASWIIGTCGLREDALKVARERMQERNDKQGAFDDYFKRRDILMEKIAGHRKNIYKLTNEQMAEINKTMGPCPEFDTFDRLRTYEVEVDKWYEEDLEPIDTVEEDFDPEPKSSET